VGRATTRALAAEGVKVGLIARNEDRLRATAREVRQLGAEALTLPLDVSDADAVDRAAERVMAEWGHIDIWVNDAMVSVFAPVRRIMPDEYRRVMDVNYLGYDPASPDRTALHLAQVLWMASERTAVTTPG
jgi:NADP-dependent 3-hydroxy acid dehydrogenase YdfG